MVKFIFQLAKALRVRQWQKNLLIFAAITFTGKLFDLKLLGLSTVAFILFCLLSAGAYLINDVVDTPSDRLHPFKKFRPIASGAIPSWFALGLAFLLIFISLLGSFTLLPRSFGVVAISFLGLQILYTFYLKHQTLFDVLVIATTFIIRIFAGEIATGYHINVWLFLSVVSLALFLALGKRRSELTLLSGGTGVLPKTRATLLHYSEKMLDVYLSMFSTATWLTYSFYAFLAEPVAIGAVFGGIFGQQQLFVADRKWLMLTIPLVVYGIMRYLLLIYEKHEGESPEKIILTDKPLISCIVIWGIMVIWVIYFIGK